MTNLIDCIVKNAIQMEPNFISPESLKDIANVDQLKNKMKVPYMTQIKTARPT